MNKYHCSICKQTITEGEDRVSTEKFGKSLCMTHQILERATPEAISLYNALKRIGIDAVLEKFDGHKHVDIAILESKIYIEIDGTQHISDENQALTDLKRTYYSFKEGYFTIRIPNILVKNDVEKVAYYVTCLINENKNQSKTMLQ